jgi:arylsulfatase A-like enzyme
MNRGIAAAACLMLALALGVMPGCQGSRPEIPAAKQRPDVIFILVDALRADGLSCYGNPNSTSPALDAYCRRGMRFSNAFSQSSHTKISVASFFTGLIPPSNGVRSAGKPVEGLDPDARVKSDVLSPELDTMAEMFGLHGYATGAVFTNPHLVTKMGFGQGFQYYDFLGFRERADVVNLAVTRWLAEAGSAPFFLYIHYMDIHAPYDPPPAYEQLFTAGLARTDIVYKNGPYRRGATPEQVAYSRAVYDGQIRYWDDELKALLSEIDRLGRSENLLVIITSDHGDEFYEHGGFGHGYTCYGEVLHIPLILVWPEVIPGQSVRHDTVSLIDLLPTLAHLVGIDTSGSGLQGRDLFAGGWEEPRPWPGFLRKPEPSPVYAETCMGKVPRSLTAGDRKVIYNETRDTFEFYNLTDDPREKRSLDPFSVDGGADLVLRLDSLMNRSPAVGPAPEVELDSSTARDLKSLGYLQ